MSTLAKPALQKQTRAAWRRAADELLIDAIFGSSPKVIRDPVLVSPSPLRSRTAEIVGMATIV